jgi:hypothetical protein
MILYSFVLKNALCSETSVGDERTEWIEKQDDNSAAKRMEESERRCMVDDGISECDWERLKGGFTVVNQSVLL